MINARSDFQNSQSPPGARLSKRSSIDSGINMESRSSGGLGGRSGKSFRDAQRLNRTDRSMSLPLGSGSSFGLGSTGSGKSIASSSATEREADSFSLSLSERTTESPSQISSNTSLLSPLRKMDFALCKLMPFYLRSIILSIPNYLPSTISLSLLIIQSIFKPLSRIYLTISLSYRPTSFNRTRPPSSAGSNTQLGFSASGFAAAFLLRHSTIRFSLSLS